MSLNHHDYLSLLREVSTTLEQLTDIAQHKTDAVLRDDLMGLDECMKQEQALSLALRGFEQKRLAALPGLDLVGVPLSMLSVHYPLDCQSEAKAVSEGLLNQYLIYNSAAEVARSTLECNLHQIEKILAEAGADPVPGFGYGVAGPVDPPPAMRTDFRA